MILHLMENYLFLLPELILWMIYSSCIFNYVVSWRRAPLIPFSSRFSLSSGLSVVSSFLIFLSFGFISSMACFGSFFSLLVFVSVNEILTNFNQCNHKILSFAWILNSKWSRSYQEVGLFILSNESTKVCMIIGVQAVDRYIWDYLAMDTKLCKTKNQKKRKLKSITNYPTNKQLNKPHREMRIHL